MRLEVRYQSVGQGTFGLLLATHIILSTLFTHLASDLLCMSPWQLLCSFAKSAPLNWFVPARFPYPVVDFATLFFEDVLQHWFKPGVGGFG